MTNKAKTYYLNLKLFYSKVFMQRSKKDIPISKRIKMLSKGFTDDQYYRYNLRNSNIDEYISEYHRWKTRSINGRYNIVLDDKLIFLEVFDKHVNVPQNLAWINNNKAYDFKGKLYSDDDLIDLLNKYKKVIVKPVIRGGGGKGISLITKANDLIQLDYKQTHLQSVIKFLRTKQDSIITEYVEQHPYSSKLYDKTVNTIRIITIFDNEIGEAKVIAAIHRIGTKDTIPVDNASKGGIVTEININSGILGIGKTYFSNTAYKYHPDSNNEIEGIQIPNWTSLKGEIKNVANIFPYIKFIAWDIVITKNGFSVLEGNASTSLDLFQLWNGARYTELGRFYTKFGIIH